MTGMVVITKSYAPDFDLCARMNQSMLENSPDTVQHHVIVPRRDMGLFQQIAGPRTHIRCDADLLPRTFVSVPFSNITVNLRRPFPPVRGWIQQQVIKLAAVAASKENVVLVADSDVEFIRPFSAETFVRDGVVRFFCSPGHIDERLPRHMIWHRVARELLGLPPAGPPHPDYISSSVTWDPVLVRRMLARVEATTGRPWTTAIAGHLDFSECVLYGVFVNEVMGAPANSFVSADSLCLYHWEHIPLTLDNVADFADRIRPTDIAVVIQSKSRTEPDVRKAILSALQAKLDLGQNPRP